MTDLAQASMAEVERLSAEGQWDRAIELLTQIIEQRAAAPPDPAGTAVLVSAYEKRALARLQTGNETSARSDFAALLQIDSNHALASVTPRTAALFAQVRKATLGVLELAFKPADASVTIEGPNAGLEATMPQSTGSVAHWLRPGDYRVSVSRPGFETVTHAFMAAPGSTERRAIALRRTSAALFITSTPAGVRVLIDGEVRGTTQPGADGQRSARLVIDGLEPRDLPYKVRFEKECFVPVADTFRVESLEAYVGTAGPDPTEPGADRVYDAVLTPAFGTLQVGADQPDAVVWIDGERRAAAAGPVTDICQGRREVEVRAAAGRFTQTVAVEYQKTTTLKARLVPTFAIVAGAAGGPDADLTTRLTRAFASSSAIRLIAAEPAAVRELNLPADWWSRQESRSAVSKQIAERLDVQGVALASRISPDASGNDVELEWIAAGASRPDAVRVTLEDGGRMAGLMERIDASVAVTRPSIGVDVVDVQRVEGAVVSAVDESGPAQGLIVPGDVIVGINASPVSNATQFVTATQSAGGGEVNVQVRSARQPDRASIVPVKIVNAPILLSMRHPGFLFNEAVVELRATLGRMRSAGAQADPQVQSAARLNLTAALMAIGDWNAAQTELNAVQLPATGRISAGTVDYLRGLVARQLGREADARAHFQHAVQDAHAMLTEHGPLISYLAKSELRLLDQTGR